MNKLECKELAIGYDISLISGTLMHCCKFKNILIKQDEYDQLRHRYFSQNKTTIKVKSDLANGIRNEHCKDCWDNEDAGLLSWRQLHNVDLTNQKVLNLNIQPSSLCNHECMYCNHKLSSTIARYGRWIDPFNADIFTHNMEGNAVKIDYADIVKFVQLDEHDDKTELMIGLTGGEPFILKDFNAHVKDIIEAFCSKKQGNKVELSISTNSNVNIEHLNNYYEMIKKLKEKYNVMVRTTISIENLEERAEYVRGGLVWSNFLDNFHCHRQNSDKLDIRMTFNAFSVVNVTDFVKFFSQYKPNFIYNYTYQKFFRVSILDKSFAKHFVDLEEYITKTELHSQVPWFRDLKSQIVDDRPNAKIFKTAITNIDSIRNTNWRSVFPEYISWFDNI
jgi:organic radical activating enzyme